MYCKKCGKEIPDDSIYCNHCGTRQIPQKVTVEFNKPNISEDDVRKGIFSFISFLKKAIKWLWNVLLLKYWLIAFIVFFLASMVLEATNYKNDRSMDTLLSICLSISTIIIGSLYIRNFRKWLYKK
jgi:uncharacterized membrane protein YvbJ